MLAWQKVVLKTNFVTINNICDMLLITCYPGRNSVQMVGKLNGTH